MARSSPSDSAASGPDSGPGAGGAPLALAAGKPGVSPPSADALAPPLSPMLVLLFSWLVPGAGHFWLGRHGKGVGFFLVIVGTFYFGFRVSQGHAVSLAEHPVAFVAQALTGLAAIVPVLRDLVASAVARIPAAPAPVPPDVVATLDLGILFTIVAGLLNLLVCVDAYGRATEPSSEPAPEAAA